MPSNIFATTGTNVSILFINKTRTNQNVFLMDASDLGEKVKDGKNQKTILSKDEIGLIQDCFISRSEKKKLSVITNIEEISKHNYALAAGQYFKTEIDYVDITDSEFNSLIDNYKNNLNSYIEIRKNTDADIQKILEEVKNA